MLAGGSGITPMFQVCYQDYIFFIPVLISFYLSLQWSLAVASWKVLVITCSMYLDVSTSGC